jgi:SagB-type dehydrogenase family enzyme
MQLPADDATTLALWYHLNSGVWSNVEAYVDSVYELHNKTILDPESISLVPAGRTPLGETIEARRSCRKFAQRTMPFDKLGRIFHSAYGITGLRHENGSSWATWGRATPSAGGLYPLELYAAIRKTDTVPDGVYHYNPIEQRLERLTCCAVSDINRCLVFPDFVENANIVLMISGAFGETLKKYGPRGYRYVMLEAGHCAQNLCLLAVESGLATVCLGGFNDRAINKTLGFDVQKEAVLYFMGIGFAA